MVHNNSMKPHVLKYDKNKLEKLHRSIKSAHIKLDKYIKSESKLKSILDSVIDVLKDNRNLDYKFFKERVS